MNCWHCKKELIWGADHDIEENEEYRMETNLSCHNCGSLVLVYYPRDKKIRKKMKRCDFFCYVALGAFLMFQFLLFFSERLF